MLRLTLGILPLFNLTISKSDFFFQVTEECITLIQLELNIFYVFLNLVILMSDNVFLGNFEYILWVYSTLF